MHGLPLGWAAAASPFGFDRPAAQKAGLIRYAGEAPVTVIAPTGSGKGVSFVIPTCLTYPGPLFVIDIKGEISAVCARRRRQLGYDVRIIDPFGVTENPGDRIDPFDLFRLPGAMLEADAEMLASMLGVGHENDRDPFWSDSGLSLVAGLIAMSVAIDDGDLPGMQFVLHHLMAEDAVRSMAELLDDHPKANDFAYSEIAAFLQHAEYQTRPSVLATARTFVRSLNSPQVSGCLRDPTLSLRKVMDGYPIDIFLVIPPQKLISHSGLLRLIVGTITNAIMRRREMPERKTLMIFDEAAQLGKQFEPLLTATTLLRGYGLQLATVWQDVSQIKSRYPTDWSTILNNSGAILSFGQGHYAAAKDAAQFLGVDPDELMTMKPDEAVLSVRGDGVIRVTRMNYLRDSMFRGMWDENPYFRRQKGMER